MFAIHGLLCILLYIYFIVFVSDPGVVHCIICIVCCILLYCIALYCIALYCIVLHSIALYCIVLHCIALYCIVLHCIQLYCNVFYCIRLYCIYCIVLVYSMPSLFYLFLTVIIIRNNILTFIKDLKPSSQCRRRFGV